MSEGRAPNDVPRGSPSPTRIALQSVTTITIQGPLPPPAMLEHYERVLPGAAERILRVAELQAGHRRHLETAVIESGVRRAGRGQVLAFVLAFGAILGGFVMMGAGQPGEGLAAMIFATASLVTVFLVSRRRDQRERERKRTELGSSPPWVE